MRRHAGLEHIATLPGVFICKPLAYLDCAGTIEANLRPRHRSLVPYNYSPCEIVAASRAGGPRYVHIPVSCPSNGTVASARRLSDAIQHYCMISALGARTATLNLYVSGYTAVQHRIPMGFSSETLIALGDMWVGSFGIVFNLSSRHPRSQPRGHSLLRRAVLHRFPRDECFLPRRGVL